MDLAPFRGRTSHNSSSTSTQLFLIFTDYYIGMFYVYILRSVKEPNRHYMGVTSNLKRRFAEHNRGDSIHTNQYQPWRLINYFAFVGKEKAEAFERYLKSGAGRRFQRRHFGE